MKPHIDTKDKQDKLAEHAMVNNLVRIIYKEQKHLKKLKPEDFMHGWNKDP